MLNYNMASYDKQRLKEYTENNIIEKMVHYRTKMMDKFNITYIKNIKECINIYLPKYEELKLERKEIRGNVYRRNKALKAWKTKHAKMYKIKDNERRKKRRIEKKEAIINERIKNGDKYGYYVVFIAKNGKKWKHLLKTKWMSEAMEIYDKKLNDNNSKVLLNNDYPKSYFSRGKGEKITYEIIIAKKINPEIEENTIKLRNKYGKLIENKIVDRNDFVIIKKDDWLIPMKYTVSGYNGYTDKKDVKWILNNLIQKSESKYDLQFISIISQFIFFKDNDTVKFIRCGSKRESTRLYDLLSKYCIKRKNIFFIGELNSTAKEDILNEAINIYNLSRNYFT